MPFTGSHPAAILPLIRLGLVPSALVIGSVVPDLPYYLPAPVDAGLTHSPAGTVTADVALGAVLYLLWHLLLARSAVAVAPAPLRARIDPAWLQRTGPVTAGDVTLVALSLAAGAATHVFWDAFTHHDGWGTGHLGWLAAEHSGLAGYRYAQYASGLLGAAAIAVRLLRWWRATPPVERPGVSPSVAGATWAFIALAGLCGALFAVTATEANSLRTIFLAGTGAAGAALTAAVLSAAILTALSSDKSHPSRRS
ncbi:DUF4184 family protein [Actinoplanes regularis]|uniref:DUF4184 family protein n=1 Tax=Actinoplanes regularis TaxID=52697 RepID=UPI0024A13B03|nr:DUF4184 family protein [Actinoplanes regularis]GLW35716.1 hypothetical protein Areg01_86510 [Actinoplanes regularis]